MQENYKKVVLTVNVEEAQKEKNKCMWEYIRYDRKYPIAVACNWALRFWIFWVVMVIPLYIIIGDFAEVVYIGIIMSLFLMLLKEGLKKMWKKNFFIQNQRFARKIIKRNKSSLLEYVFTDYGIEESYPQKQIITWDNIHGYFQKDSWIGLINKSEPKTKLIMVKEDVLQEEDKEILHNLLNSKIKKKAVDWKYVYKRNKVDIEKINIEIQKVNAFKNLNDGKKRWTVSVDIEKAQNALTNIIAKYKSRWLGNYILSSIYVLLGCWDIIEWQVIGKHYKINHYIIVGVSILIIGFVIGASVKCIKRNNRDFYIGRSKIIKEIIEKNKSNMIQYEFADEGIIEYSVDEKFIFWNEVEGYFREDGWVGLYLKKDNPMHFIMIDESKLNIENLKLLEYSLNYKISQKKIKWGKCYGEAVIL